MNRPVHILEPSSLFSTGTPGMVNKGRCEGGESSFSSILSRNKGEPTGAESGQLLPASGKKLPEQQVRVEDQQHAADSSPVTLEQTGASGASDELVELPDDLSALTVPQQIPVPDVPEIEETGVTEKSEDTGESASAMAAAQQLQGQAVDVRIIAKTSPGNLSVVNEKVQQQDKVHDVSGLKGLSASYLATAEAGRKSAATEPAVNAVREAVHVAVTNQAPGRDLQQFLQQNLKHQAAGDISPVLNRADGGAVPFLQTLSENSLVTPSARVPVPVGQPGWGQAVGSQVVWHVSQNISAASLRLNPQHLGPMEMEVSLHGDKASISFTSQQVLVRDALESSIPRLRDMLAENGLDLVNVNVSQQGKSHQNGQGASGSRQEAGVANDGGTNESASGPGLRQMTTLAKGLVDFYA